MGSGNTKQLEYYKKNYKTEFTGIRNIRKYFLFKGLANNEINLTRSFITNQLVYKNKRSR